MAGVYTIGTKLGYDLANGMKVGQTIEVANGTTWTKNLNGTITVNQWGNTMPAEITYQPTQEDMGLLPNNAKQQATQRQETIAQMSGVPEYVSPYADDLRKVIAGLQDSKWEGWDKNADPAYQAYRKEYLREADRTMEDTLGAYAQNTGGIAGTSAISAASQAAYYYKSKLADAIPTLHDNAYNRYLQGVAQKQNMANLLMSADSHANSQYYQRISYAMNKWAQLGYADQEVAGILGVTAGTPTSDQSYSDWSTAFNEQQYNHQMEEQARAKAEAELQEKLAAITVKPGVGQTGQWQSEDLLPDIDESEVGKSAENQIWAMRSAGATAGEAIAYLNEARSIIGETEYERLKNIVYKWGGV